MKFSGLLTTFFIFASLSANEITNLLPTVNKITNLLPTAADPIAIMRQVKPFRTIKLSCKITTQVGLNKKEESMIVIYNPGRKSYSITETIGQGENATKLFITQNGEFQKRLLEKNGVPPHFDIDQLSGHENLINIFPLLYGSDMDILFGRDVNFCSALIGNQQVVLQDLYLYTLDPSTRSIKQRDKVVRKNEANVVLQSISIRSYAKKMGYIIPVDFTIIDNQDDAQKKINVTIDESSIELDVPVLDSVFDQSIPVGAHVHVAQTNESYVNFDLSTPAARSSCEEKINDNLSKVKPNE